MSTKFELTVEPSLPASDVTYLALIRALGEMHAAVPLVSFRFEVTAPAALTYDYRLTAVDGRVWKQVVDFSAPDPTDPTMTFDVVPGWKLKSEFSHQRPIRDAVVALRGTYAVTKILAKYL